MSCTALPDLRFPGILIDNVLEMVLESLGFRFVYPFENVKNNAGESSGGQVDFLIVWYLTDVAIVGC